MKKLNTLVDKHLDLQVRISFNDHLGFLERNGLINCNNVLDVGSGNGTFIKAIAQNYPAIQFTGVDKRIQLVELSLKEIVPNFNAFKVDMFSTKGDFDLSVFDGMIFRYFFLHVDHSQKLLNFIHSKIKQNCKLWIIDLDWSQITCSPDHPSFDKFLMIIKDFCQKTSIESQGGKNIISLLEQTGFKNIKHEYLPFEAKNITLSEFASYLKQEILCYSQMLGSSISKEIIFEVCTFIENYIETGKVSISYGMILVTATK